MNVLPDGMSKAFKAEWKVVDIGASFEVVQAELNSLSDQGFDVVNIQYIETFTHFSYSHQPDYSAPTATKLLNSKTGHVDYRVQIIARKWHPVDL